MTPRDRTVLGVIGLFVLAAAGWFLMLAPVRKDASAADAEVAAAQARVTAAETTVAGGRKAKAGYRSDYATVARLGKAVPTDDDVASLIVQLRQAAHRSRIDLRSIELAATAGSGTPTTAAAPALGGATGASGAIGAVSAAPAPAAALAAPSTTPPGVGVDAAGNPTVAFDLSFRGGFFRIGDFVNRITRFVRVEGQKTKVDGRLLKIDGFSLQPSDNGFKAMEASLHVIAFLRAPDGAPAAPEAAPGTAAAPIDAAATAGLPASPATETR